MDHKILDTNQFGFQTGCKTGHANMQLVDQIHQSFEENRYTLGVFIDLSKPFIRWIIGSY